MDNRLRWDQVRYFLAVARAGSVVGAARALGVSHATVIRNVAQLEERLGVRLFDHVRSGYRLTADGADALTSASAMEEHAEALLRRAMGSNPRPQGVLKLVLGDSSLFDPMPLLRGFQAAQPGVELAVEDARDDAESRLAELRADAAVLVTSNPPEALVGRQLTRLRFAWFAAADLDVGLAGSADDCGWIVWGSGATGELDADWQRAALHRLTPRPRIVLQTDKHADALAAVRAGLGVGLLCDQGGDDLQPAPFPAPREAVGVWLLTHPDLRRAGPVRALFDYVAETFHAA